MNILTLTLKHTFLTPTPTLNTFVIFLLPHQIDILLKQIYLNNLNNNEMFIKQI